MNKLYITTAMDKLEITTANFCNIISRVTTTISAIQASIDYCLEDAKKNGANDEVLQYLKDVIKSHID